MLALYHLPRPGGRAYLDVYVSVWVANCGREVGGGDCVAASGLEKNESKGVSYDECYEAALTVASTRALLIRAAVLLEIALAIAAAVGPPRVLWPLRHTT